MYEVTSSMWRWLKQGIRHSLPDVMHEEIPSVRALYPSMHLPFYPVYPTSVLYVHTVYDRIMTS